MSNFKFLETINKDIYNLGYTAEKLFRDEYYDQCITQTRKMAEAMTKEVLGCKAQSDDTFDDMIYKLKTISCNTLKEQEFISDMYYLKKQGNIAVHSAKSENSGKTALECLEHAFEAAINFASVRSKDEMIKLLLFDEKLLVTGEKNNNLEKEYKERIQQERKQNKKTEQTNNNHTNIFNKNEKSDKPEENKTSIFFKLFKTSVAISIIAAAILLLLNQTGGESNQIINSQTLITKNEKINQNAKSSNKLTPEQFTLSGNFSKAK